MESEWANIYQRLYSHFPSKNDYVSVAKSEYFKPNFTLKQFIRILHGLSEIYLQKYDSIHLVSNLAFSFTVIERLLFRWAFGHVE